MFITPTKTQPITPFSMRGLRIPQRQRKQQWWRRQSGVPSIHRSALRSAKARRRFCGAIVSRIGAGARYAEEYSEVGPQLFRKCVQAAVTNTLARTMESVQSAALGSLCQRPSHERHAARNASSRGVRVLKLSCTNRSETQACTTTTMSVSSAVSHVESQRSRPVQQNVIERTVVSVRPLNISAPVYNLATSDGTYFANGVLTSNCDALRYLVFSDANSIGTTPEGIRRTRDYRRYGVFGGRQE